MRTVIGRPRRYSQSDALAVAGNAKRASAISRELTDARLLWLQAVRLRLRRLCAPAHDRRGAERIAEQFRAAWNKPAKRGVYGFILAYIGYRFEVLMFSVRKLSPLRLLGTAIVSLTVASAQPVAFAASELDTLDKGPAVGTSIPHPLTAPDQANKVRDFSSLVGENGLIVLFSRSFDW